MSNYLGIQPDIIVLGKALGNGYPISVVGGKRKFMDTPDYFISSTHAGELSGIEAALSTLDYLTPAKLSNLWERGKWFQAQFNKITPKLQIVGLPTRAVWEGEELFKALFWQTMCKSGVLLGKAFFLNFNHTRKLLRDVLSLSKKVVKAIEGGKVKLEGQLPLEVFKRT